MNSQAIMDSERAHYLVQLGTYFTDLSDLYGENYVLRIASTINVNDIYYNQAYGINAHKNSVEEMLQRVETHFQDKNRTPCFYTTPASLPVDLPRLLEAKKYVVADEESWMYVQPQTSSRKPINKVSVNLCSSEPDMKIYSDIYVATLGGEEGFDVKKFLDEVVISHKFPPSARTVYHYLTRIGGEPVGIASAFIIGQYCGVYNVGTLDKFRGKGVASSTLARLRVDVENLGAKIDYLTQLSFE